MSSAAPVAFGFFTPCPRGLTQSAMHQPSGTTSQAERLGVPLPPPGPPPANVPPAGPAGDPTVNATVNVTVDPTADPTALPRNTSRRDLPVESPGRMVLSTRQSVFVTLHDISRGGCCVVRKGPLPLKTGERVSIEMWREDIQTKVSLEASVRWVRHHDGTTKAGLRFLDNSAKTHRLIDQYLHRSFNPGA